MRTRNVEFRAIPQFDCGRWKLRLERVPVDHVNETMIGIDFDSAAQPGVNKTLEGRFVAVTDRARQTRTINILSNESGGASD